MPLPEPLWYVTMRHKITHLLGDTMSEELIQTVPQKIGNYTYFKLGATTLNQLKASGIIPKKNYGNLGSKKPDGLVIHHGAVKAVIEYKLPEKLSSESQIKSAIEQEITVAKKLCKILIVTDGTKSFWVNALNGDFIKDEKNNNITAIFNPLLVKNVDTIEHLIESIDSSINESSSVIKSVKLIDPSPLAARLWQTIWVATGKSPVKCLYNVVELFIFKFLSDLKILDPDVSFENIYKKGQSEPSSALDFYARNTRHKIYQLFPRGTDGTTIINGTIFVNEKGEANLSQSILFVRSLEHLQKYSEEFGSLTKIDKQFKTRLYESFLKQEVEALGQYFTPRKIVQSVIRMAGLDETSFQFSGKRICDPFCGVGGFPLELINMNENIKSCYTPTPKGEISLPFVLNGFDKGFERDDERTIILAKANMLIYLAELLFAYPQRSPEFAKIFNNTFSLFKDNLGTFGHIIKNEDEKYDFILSNPPYVTSGSGIIKEEIQKTAKTKNEYPINALGLEGLSIEWIVNSLKKGGKAFVVIPDGILSRVGGKKLRDFILHECFLDAIISLPVRTFFANFKQTYILAVTKKHDTNNIQEDHVFTYIVSNIGERLTSVKRDEIDDNDLPELETLFRIFLGARNSSKSILEKQTIRCKILPITHFRKSTHWVIDRLWNRQEKISIGVEETFKKISKQEIDNLLTTLNNAMDEYEKFRDSHKVSFNSFKEIKLGDTALFNLFIGKRITKNKLPEIQGDVPAFSANVFEPFGLIAQTNIKDFTSPSILWAIDGNFEFNIMQPGEVFATTDHCGTIQILASDIIPEYLLYALNLQKTEESFDRSFRASLSNMRRFTIKIPVHDDGSFDIDTQKTIAAYFIEQEDKKNQLNAIKEEFNNMMTHYLASQILQ